MYVVKIHKIPYEPYLRSAFVESEKQQGFGFVIVDKSEITENMSYDNSHNTYSNKTFFRGNNLNHLWTTTRRRQLRTGPLSLQLLQKMLRRH